MLKKLSKSALFLMACLLLAPSPAQAQVSCSPEDFSLEIDMNEPEYGYVVGELQTPTQEYSYHFERVTDPDEKDISYVKLHIEPPDEEFLSTHVSSLKIEEELFIPEDARYLVILVVSDYRWGPSHFIGKIPQAGYGACMKMQMKKTQ